MAERARVVELFIHEGGRGRGGGPPPGPPPGGPYDDHPSSPVFASEDYLAVELVRDLAGDWRCAGGRWHHWDGMRWRPEQTKLLWELSRQVCRRVALTLEQASARERTSRKNTHYAVATIAEADRAVALAIGDFDRDKWLLNTPDGIVDLKSGQLLPHDRNALMTKMAAAGPMPRADEPEDACPVFMRYLADATGGNAAMMKYLQRVAGYCLTGSIEEHCILFFHGPGGSGKSTFLLLLQDLLGDYARNAPMNAFTVAQGERHLAEVAYFVGARIVTASEVEEGMRWDEGKLKAISGGDKITARFMRGDPFEFEPQFKLLLAGNHRPRMRSADDAMLRRMQVIPFTHKPQKADKQLREKLQAELGAILRWAIEGEAERRRLGGLMPPAAVQNATNEYFRDENTLGRWIDERCDCDGGYWAGTRELYRDFVGWARRVGEYVLSERIFSQKLEQMPGITKALHPKTRIKGFAGLRLHYSGDELPLDGVAAGQAARPVVRANELPLEPAADPADDWER